MTLRFDFRQTNPKTLIQLNNEMYRTKKTSKLMSSFKTSKSIPVSLLNSTDRFTMELNLRTQIVVQQFI